MSEETIVAVFDTADHAEAAVRDLVTDKVPEDAISRHASVDAANTGASRTAPEKEGFWSSLFGGEPDHSTEVYDRSIQNGATVVTVRVPQEHVARVTGLLEAHHPVDLDDRAAQYGLSPVPHPDTTTRPEPRDDAPQDRATANSDTLQLSEESLAVGKRVVNRGGTRIRRFVVETPVEKEITLYDESVTLDRHPVSGDHQIDAANAFTDKTIEMTESHEEAVVSKTAHVVEEIALRKKATDRVETVSDTLRREDVEIEQIPGDKTSSTGSTTTMTPRPNAA